MCGIPGLKTSMGCRISLALLPPHGGTESKPAWDVPLLGCPLTSPSSRQPGLGTVCPVWLGTAASQHLLLIVLDCPVPSPQANQPQELLRRPWQREDRIPAHIKKFKQGCTDCNSCSVHFHCSDKQAAQEPKEVSLAPCTSLAQGTGRACGKPFIWGLSLRPAWHRAAGGWHLLCVCSALRRRC